MKVSLGWRILLSACLMMTVLAPSKDFTASAETADSWWHEDWPYRIQIKVNESQAVSINLDFTQLFSELGLGGALLDLDSLRMVPYKDGVPASPVPFEETYTTLFLDADTLNQDGTSPDPYWEAETDWTLSLDSAQHTQGTGAFHAHVQIKDTSPEKTGFNYHFNTSTGLDWSDYELLLYDAWPQVNASAIDQTPDVYFFELGGLGTCPNNVINGPALMMDAWNTAFVSLKPYGNCQNPDASTLGFLKFSVKVNCSHDNHGYFDPGDELDLWLDNFRLLDQDGPGEIRWEADSNFDSYYLYFDTINHTGHAKPTFTTISGPALPVSHESPEAGGYFHNVANAAAGGLSIWAAPISEKILRTSKNPAATKPLAISGAKGELEPFQLVVNAPTTQSLTVSALPLIHNNGTAIIAAQRIEIFRVDYVTLTYLSDFYGRAAEWPDPLYPVSLGDPVIFPAGENQPLWIRVRIPDSASPGTYTGSITIGSAIVPFSLNVWGFTLPNRQYLKNQIGFDWNTVMEAYGGTISGVPQPCYSQVESDIVAALVDYKMTPNEVLPADVALYSLTAYEVNKAHDQQVQEEKRVWWHYAPSDLPPHINPAVMDRPAVEGRFLPWLAWIDRVDGLYYPQSADWDPDPWIFPFSNDSSNGDGFFFYPPKDNALGFDPCNPKSNRLIPSVRLELLREGLDDYAYLWLLNQGKPLINQENPGDILAKSMVGSRTLISQIPTVFDAKRQTIAGQLEAKQLYLFLPLLIH